MSKWTVTQDTINWINLEKAQDKGLLFWQTRSDAIIFYNSVPADCVETVVKTQTTEILYKKVSLSPRPPPKIILKEARQAQRDDSHQRDTGMVKPVAEEEKRELKIDLRVQGIPQAAVEQESED